jgi:alkaline phosphatase
MVAFDQAVARALEMTDPADTLLVVTADHSHPLTLNGYPLVGRNDDGSEDVAQTRRSLMGSGGVDLRGRPYSALTFASGPGAAEPLPPSSDRPALIPLSYSTHTGEDVFVAARGPGAEHVRGFLTNTDVYRILRAAWP